MSRLFEIIFENNLNSISSKIINSEFKKLKLKNDSLNPEQKMALNEAIINPEIFCLHGYVASLIQFSLV